MMQVLAHQSLFSCTNHCTSSPQLASASWFCCGSQCTEISVGWFQFCHHFPEGGTIQQAPICQQSGLPLWPRPEPEELTSCSDTCTSPCDDWTGLHIHPGWSECTVNSWDALVYNTDLYTEKYKTRRVHGMAGWKKGKDITLTSRGSSLQTRPASALPRGCSQARQFRDLRTSATFLIYGLVS